MSKSDLSISSKSKRSDFPKERWQDWPFDQKVRLFQEQIQGWTIDVAKDIKQKQIPHADFAILSILLSYFENIAKFMEGYNGKGESKSHFIKGIKYVYPKKFQEKTLELLYDQARNGMYHVGLTGTKVQLDCSIESGLIYKQKGFIACPEKLIYEIQGHFNHYCTRLKNPQNRALRSNFEKREKFILGT
ncbi:hypothetical protein A2773_07135 [Candidatus Gottesmanbacteria bacterium RIFCSPHIGHO2_01_FULL_39_10]|uniref:Uncharacterized protein n=1 Tax=Candidatus Gottesmanbacteria bacterium RIFCSPHIGHO2_01_FULL_39_10 TaxID=1798375 RepID=A0A1F5ZM02_9BACT|nr:MAG: hypothetical protein A2773_07135 [Candidatus Gottesmanbacteria bacterium RIFCSPHIGHO2_01_FULL_39_10]